MSYTFRIEPLTYSTFEDEIELIEKCKAWGLLTPKASKIKAFSYKGNRVNIPCSIIGYVDDMTAVIQFDNGELHCIHPSYLKEMQAGSYGQKNTVQESSIDLEESSDNPSAQEPSSAPVDQSTPVASALTAPAEDKPDKPKAAKKRTSKKLDLPEEKVTMTAVVKEFTTVPNHFSDDDDEVIIYEEVRIVEPELVIGDAWSSHSNTLKKLELEVGDQISFDAKVVAKKLTRHPVPYKINNPSKLQKL